ncbi:MAG: lysophospholipid acyltransferase family protein [Opitutaceae bacterium]
MRVCLTVYQSLAYYLSFFFFGSSGLLLNLFCLLLRWLPDTPRVEHFFQRLICRHFSLFLWWLRRSHLILVNYEGFEHLPRGRGLVLVANHPGLMDITYLLARVPEAVCIFKPAIQRNPVLGAAARSAGYLANDGGIDLIRAAAAKVAAGRTLVIFPEGTRTRGGPLNPFKPGFALIAQRTRAPIQTVRITCDSDILIKNRAWWKIPRMPAHVTVTLGPCFPPPETRLAAATVTEVEAWFRDALIGHPAVSAATTF